MKYRFGRKILIAFCVSLVMSLFVGVKSFASDYQYKILDPKYNPQAEKLLEGKLPDIEDVTLPKEHRHFNFKLFLSLIILVTFPIGVIYICSKQYKKFMNEIPGQEPLIKPIKVERKDISKKTSKIIPVQSEKSAEKQSDNYQIHLKNESKIPITIGNSINKYFTLPIEKPQKHHPMLINTSVLSGNKGICLVQYNKTYSLIGYINNEIFMLNQFKSLNGVEIRARLSETVKGKDRYIVRLGNFKGLVEVSDEKMKLLLEL